LSTAQTQTAGGTLSGTRGRMEVCTHTKEEVKKILPPLL
jgi:hypothetical protein